MLPTQLIPSLHEQLAQARSVVLAIICVVTGSIAWNVKRSIGSWALRGRITHLITESHGMPFC